MWDERYNTDEFVYGTAPNSFLASVVQQLPKGRVLSLCEGEGRNAVHLAEQGFRVLGVDASAVGLAKARRLAAARCVEIETQVVDLADFSIEPESWDVITSIFCHIPPALRRALHRQVVAGLRPGGMLVLEAYHPAQLNYGTGGPASTELTVTLDALQEELSGLRFLQAQELLREVIEGRLHTGTGAVVQILAAKP